MCSRIHQGPCPHTPLTHWLIVMAFPYTLSHRENPLSIALQGRPQEPWWSWRWVRKAGQLNSSETQPLALSWGVAGLQKVKVLALKFRGPKGASSCRKTTLVGEEPSVVQAAGTWGLLFHLGLWSWQQGRCQVYPSPIAVLHSPV